MTHHYHFSKGVYKEHPNRWYAWVECRDHNGVHYNTQKPMFNDLFADNHYQKSLEKIIAQMKEARYSTNIEEVINPNSKNKRNEGTICKQLYITFADEADEAEFILKYNDGIEL